ncbi:hypothetical protein ABZ446_32715 [Streptomyces sp. NPDC005813]|uniref:hypothetical protein n=1 Tax=Streptomyces sp. NPDC005813 TaxID=3155592 RepID=UPI0033C7692B
MLKHALTSLTVLFACVGAVSTSGYTIKDDLVPYVQGLAKEDASFKIRTPTPRDKPVIVKRCTDVTVRVTGALPAGHELWLGTNLQGRKAIVEPLDDAGDGIYRASITIGRQEDHDQPRELDVVLITPEAADWLQVVADGRSLYDVASNTWLPGVRVVARMDVQRGAATDELNCKGKV